VGYRQWNESNHRGCLAAGAVGAVISVLSRVTFGDSGWPTTPVVLLRLSGTSPR
jgi:hypothetical protein